MNKIDQDVLRILAAAARDGDGWLSLVTIWLKTRNRWGRPRFPVTVFIRLRVLVEEGCIESKRTEVAAPPYPRRRVYRVSDKGHRERAALRGREGRWWFAPAGIPGPEGA